MRVAALVVAFVVVGAGRASPQDYDGYFSTLFVAMPDLDAAGGRQPIGELRTRLFAQGLFTWGDYWYLRLGSYVDALVAERREGGRSGSITAAIVRPADLYLEVRAESFDIRVGASRIVWGRLDEFQPTDVVNPIDLSRFLLEGRSEARLPVGLVRGRAFLPGGSALEGIVVPVFRASRFDLLDEDTSPFLLAPAGVRERREPGTSWKNVQGGARFTSTVGRVDWGVSAWRGFESFPLYVPQFAPDPLALVVPAFVETFPRFTMVGADFETVRGPWGLRGEFAWYDRVSPQSFEGGVGADRRAGDYRVAVNLLVSRADDTDLTLVGWAERTFARETRAARVLAVYDPADETAFIRGVGAVSVRENLWLEGSIGWFTAEPDGGSQASADVLSLLSRRDFVYARLKFYF